MNKQLKDLVYNYPTKHEQGFIRAELQDILSKFPDIRMDKYNDAMMGNTCMLDKIDGVIIYHCDVYKAILCGIEDRNLTLNEWD
jgi:hypothetical protein